MSVVTIDGPVDIKPVMTNNSSGGVARGEITIDFDSFAPTAAFPGGVEDGFLIDVPIGPISVDGLFPVLLGGPYSAPNSIHHPTDAHAAFAITNINGSAFTLESFYAGSDFGGADPLIVTGFFDGVVVAVDVFDPNPPGTYVMYTPKNLLGVPVDTLFYDLGPSSVGPTHIDDITLATIVVSPLGDANGDGILNNDDIASFVLALTSYAAYRAMFPDLNPDVVLDMNGDGGFNNGDIAGFVATLTGR